jgi:HSP20 family protein
MDNFFGGNRMAERFSGESNFLPAVNIIEEKDNYRIEIAAPGLEKKDFKIDVRDNVLTISSEKKVEKEENDKNYVRKEFSYSTFQRSFTLPETVDVEKIKAKHDDGILNIQIPKKPEAVEKAPRRISIS